MKRYIGIEFSTILNLTKKGRKQKYNKKSIRAEGISPWKSNKDAVSASCILPGPAPIRTILEKNDAVEIFYLKSRLGIMIFQKHCMLKVWLTLPNDQTELLNEKIY